MKKKIIKRVLYSLLALIVIFLSALTWWSYQFVQYEKYQDAKYQESIDAHLSSKEVFTLPNCDEDEPMSCLKYLDRDVNFDGKIDYVERQLKAGQRFRDSFEVYEGGHTLLTDIPFNQIDSSTKFDPVNKTIEIMRSGGACGSEYETYKVEDGKAKSIRLEKYDYMDKDGNRIGCTRYIYEGSVLVSEEKVVR